MVPEIAVFTRNARRVPVVDNPIATPQLDDEVDIIVITPRNYLKFVSQQ